MGARSARAAAFGLVLAVMLAGCQPPPQTLDPEAEPFARAFFEEVRTGADVQADPHLAHELKDPTTSAQLAQFRALIPDEPARTIEMTSWDAKTGNEGVTTRVTIVYRYPDRTLVAQTALFKSPGGKDPVIVGFRITPGPPP